MSAKRSPKKPEKSKPAEENHGEKYFHEFAFDVIWHAQFGDNYDRELMDALSQLDQAEHFARSDFETLGIKGENGSVKPVGKWNHEQALADLQAARDEFWRVKERIGAARCGENVFEIIAQHSVRLAEWMEFSKHGNPEIAILARLAEWLYQADGTIPTYSRVTAMLSALKDASTLFGRKKGEVSHTTDTKAVDKAIELWVKHQKKRDPGCSAKHWQEIWTKQMLAIAERIHVEKLFGDVRADKLLKRNGVTLPLKSGVDKSSPLFGQNSK